MISICIPIYNCDVRKLVRELYQQANELVIRFEILLIDDASEQSYKSLNKELAELTEVTYIELPTNIGRAAIRNLLAKEAKHQYLIFMDCDAQVANADYIKNYLRYCQLQTICCGGRSNLEACPDPQFYLRWHYSIHKEQIDAATRSKRPNQSFLTFNFLIDRDIFKTVSFDEQVKGYGHEDTLFGLKLEESHLTITHIDNQLLHVDLDDTDTFIQKTEQSISNLIDIESRIENKVQFVNSVKLLRMEKKITALQLSPLLIFFFKTSRKAMLHNLRGQHANLFVFDLYKLGYLSYLRSLS